MTGSEDKAKAQSPPSSSRFSLSIKNTATSADGKAQQDPEAQTQGQNQSRNNSGQLNYWSPSVSYGAPGEQQPGLPRMETVGNVSRHKSVLRFDRVSSTVMEKRVKAALHTFDQNKDGTLDMDELTALVEHLLREENNSRILKYMFLGLCIFCLILIGATTGLTYAMVYALKDTTVSETNVMVSESSGDPIQVANSEFFVDPDGRLQPRAFKGQTVQGDNGALRVSTYSGLPQGLTSVMDIGDLMELNYLQISTPDGTGEVALKVQGVARVPMPQSQQGSVINILTVAGTIYLDGQDLTFGEKLEPVFRTAGFIRTGATGTRRRRVLSAANGQSIAGRYNRRVNVPTTPDPPGWVNRTAWRLMDKKDKKAAKDATRWLKKLMDDRANERAYAAMWYDYKVLNDKAYETMEDDYTAFLAWKDNILTLLDTNFDDTISYWTTLNLFSDMNFETFASTVLQTNTVFSERVSDNNDTEFEQEVEVDVTNGTNATIVGGRRMLMGADGSRRILAKVMKAKDLPPLANYVNWTAQGKTTPIRNQGHCGACWTFAATAVIESAMLIVNKSLDASTLDLSEQQFVNCVNKRTGKAFSGSEGCSGGDPYDGIAYAGMYNQTTEWIMPYDGIEKFCDTSRLRYTQPGQAVKAGKGNPGFVKPGNDEQALMRAVMRQPVAAAVVVDNNMKAYAPGGIFEGQRCNNQNRKFGQCPTVNHIITVTGYDIRGPDKYWIIRNSWGPTWGDNGYMRMRMSGDQWGPSGLYETSAYPILEQISTAWIDTSGATPSPSG